MILDHITYFCVVMLLIPVLRYTKHWWQWIGFGLLLYVVSWCMGLVIHPVGAVGAVLLALWLYNNFFFRWFPPEE